MSEGISIIALGVVGDVAASVLSVEHEILESKLAADAVVVNHTEELNALMMGARHDWLLLMRRGEAIGPELAREIEEATRSARAWGYRIGVDLHYCGAPLRLDAGAGEIRLVHRRHARFNPNPGAREMFVQGTVVRLGQKFRRVLYDSSSAHHQALAKTMRQRSLAGSIFIFTARLISERLFLRGGNAMRHLWIETRYRGTGR